MSKKSIDSNNIIEVIKGTIRGKIAVVFAVLGILFLFAEFSVGASGISAFGPMILFELLAAWQLSSAANSIEKKQKAAADKKKEDKIARIKRSASKCVGDYLYVDEPNQLWCVPTVSTKQYAFSDLLDFDIVENGDVVWGGSLLGTAVGAMAGGITGALMGATASKPNAICENLSIKLSVNSIDNPIIYIKLITSQTNKDWPDYKKAAAIAEEICGVLAVIKARNGR